MRIVFVFFTILLILAYGLACLTPFISAVDWVVMGFLGLAFPVLLVLLLLLALVWFFIRKKTAWVFLLLFVCGSWHILHLFGFHSGKFIITKPTGTVRIMGWNVQGFNSHDNYLDSFNSIRHRLFRYIQQQQPDILCLQDFVEYHHPLLPSNIKMLADSLHYPYYITSDDYKEFSPWGPMYSGIGMFSRYPLQNSKHILYGGKNRPESILTADITINEKTYRVIMTHLQSMHLYNNLHVLSYPGKITDEDSTINESGTTLSKLAFYLPYHAQQAILVKKTIDESPWPVIFSADMNEVPSSWCYYKIKGSLQDAFLVKGSGLGRTYTTISPTLRIDYLMASAGIKIMQYLNDTVHLSDHYPNLMDVKW